ncbi:hypothetical protein HDU81_002080 [Chytriomyces hyalinus]|nr:hypothetical protein HDU81_002080 [Chytriomyces hyalinus]
MPDAFSKTNLLNEYIRGFDAGACCAAGIMLAFLFRSIPSKTAIAATLIYMFLLAIAIGTFLADYLLITDCYLRVKLVNLSVLLNNVVFWIFQADLTHTVTTGISSSIPGTSYIIIGTLLYQCAEACYILYCYEAKTDPNGVCELTLDPKLFILDKSSEVTYSLIVAVLFLYPLVVSAHELDGLAPSNQHKDQQLKDSVVTRHAQSRPNANNGYTQPWVAAKLRLIKVMRHRGFILILSLLAKILHIICVLTSDNPTILTTWNGFFACENTLLMAVHICSTLEPTVVKLSAVTSTRKSLSHSLAQTSKGSAISIPVDEFSVPCSSVRPLSHIAVSPGAAASLPRRFEGDRHGPLDMHHERLNI